MGLQLGLIKKKGFSFFFHVSCYIYIYVYLDIHLDFLGAYCLVLYHGYSRPLLPSCWCIYWFIRNTPYFYSYLDFSWYQSLGRFQASLYHQRSIVVPCIIPKRACRRGFPSQAFSVLPSEIHCNPNLKPFSLFFPAIATMSFLLTTIAGLPGFT